VAPLPRVELRKLNGPLAQAPGDGIVVQSAVTPDGNSVAYLVSQESLDLYGAPTDGSSAAVKLSHAGGGVLLNSFLISPDGTRVVYQGTLEPGDHEVFSVPIDGSSSPVRLNGELADGGDVPFDGNGPPVRISADGARVVYVADQDTNDVFELYSVPIDGSSPPTKLASMATGWDIDLQYQRGFLISPDGSTVVYLARNDPNHNELFRVPIDGSQPPVQISEVSFLFHQIIDWSFSPDGSVIVYQGFSGTTPVELFRVPTDASSPPIRLHPAYGSENHVDDYAISPDGTRVAYLADVTTDAADYNDPVELFSVPIDGSAAPIKLNPPITRDGSIDGRGFAISPGGSRVLYVADQDAYEVFELYSVPLDGSLGAVKLSGAMVSGGDVLDESSAIRPFAFTPDGTRVVYRADQTTNEKRELYSVPIDGSASAIPIVGALAGSVQPGFTLTGSSAVFVADKDVFGTFELYSVPADGSGSAVQINPPLPPGADVQTTYSVFDVGFQVTGTGAVVYRADQDTTDLVELYAAPLAGGGDSIRLNGPFGGGPVIGEVREVKMTRDGTRAVYRADQEQNWRIELFSVTTLRTPHAPVRLNGPFTLDDAVEDLSISPDGNRVVFTQSQRTSSATRLDTLQSAPIDGSAPAVQLSRSGDAVRLTSAHEISADGSRVVFLADTDPSSALKLELFSAPVDGSALAVELGETPAGNAMNDASSFEISADGTRVVYRSDQDVAGVVELYSAPIDGSEAAVKISGTLAAGGDVTGFALNPDATRVVFRADEQVNDTFELYSAPIAGGQAPVKVSGTLVAGGSVATDFAVAADGGFVVFRADKHVDNVFELYSAPVDGATPPVELNASLDAFPLRDILGFRLAPDGSRAVYRGNQDVLRQIELYSVPIDGEASPVRLSGPDFSGSDLHGVQGDFAITADGERVVYRSDQLEQETMTLYSAPLDGGTSAALLNGPLVEDGDVLTGFALSADCKHVLYRADQEFDERIELYDAPIAGGASARKVNAALVPDGDVSPDFALSPNGDRIVYRAEQELDAIKELYLSTQSHAVRPATAKPASQ